MKKNGSGPNYKNRRAKWFRRFGVISACLIAVAFLAWYLLNWYVRTEMKGQLSALTGSEVKIGSVSVFPDGVQANDVRFFKGKSGVTFWVSVKKLAIEHSVAALAAGADHYDAIEVSGVDVKYDARDLLGDRDGSKLDLQSIHLPTDVIRFKDIAIALHDTESRKLEAVGICGQLQNRNGLKIEGTIEQLAGGRWSFIGTADADGEAASLSLVSETLNLRTEQWSEWPLMPDDLDRFIKIDGTVSANLQIRLPLGDQLDGQGQLNLKNLSLELPQFDLPLNLSAGEIRFRNGTIEYSGCTLTTGEGGQLKGSGKTDVSAFPIVATFEGRYDKVPVDTWRQLAPTVPEVISGSTSGPFKASMSIEESFCSSIAVRSTADVTDGAYGKLSTTDLVADVQVDDLKFDDKQVFESVAGSVKVTGGFRDQLASDLLATFELNDLQDQVAFAGKGNGRLELTLPLSTLSDLASWQLDVDATMPEGEIAGQLFEQANVQGTLRNGILSLAPVLIATKKHDKSLSAKLDGQHFPDHDLTLRIDWPLTDSTTLKDRAKINAQGTKIGVRWLTGFLSHQVSTSSGRSFDHATKAVNQLDGNINFEVNLSISASDPADTDGWLGEVAMVDSEFSFDDARLKSLGFDLTLNDSILRITNLTGQFSEGPSLSCSSQIDIVDPSRYSLALQAQETPMPWAVDLFEALRRSEVLPSLSRSDNSSVSDWLAQLETQIGEDKFQGTFDLSVELSNELVAESPDADTWRAAASINSENLTVSDHQLNQIEVDLTSSSRELIVKRFSMKVDEGSIEGSGNWYFNRTSGEGSLQWDAIPVSSMAAFTGLGDLLTGGKSSGSIQIDSPDFTTAQELDLPLRLEGNLGVTDLALHRVKLNPFQVGISTSNENNENQIVLENLQPSMGPTGIQTRATVSLTPPYKFTVVGEMDGAQLSKIARQPSIIDQASDLVDVTGTLDGNFQAAGQIQNFDVRTDGMIRVTRPTLNLKRIGDFKIDWEHIGNDWNQSKLLVHAFDGVVEMQELSRVPERVRMKIERIDAEQMTKMFGLPFEMSGKLDGTASLNDWSLYESRWIDMTLKGSSLNVNHSEFGDFQAKALLKTDDLRYGLSGSFLNGKIEGAGKTKIVENSFWTATFPLELSIKNASLESLHRRTSSLRPLSGRLAGVANFLLAANGEIKGEGRLGLEDVKWNKNLVTREASIRIKVDDNRIVFDDVKADLKRGTISATATVPRRGKLGGTYEVAVHQLDLERLTNVFDFDRLEATGLVDARLGGLIGREVTGRGYVGVDRASLHGVAGQSLRLPVQYQFSPVDQSGRIEVRHSKFRLFDGKVSGVGRIEFGRRLDVSTELELTNVNTGDLIEAVADLHDFDQGKLSGKVKLYGRNVRTARDLKGSFNGELTRAEAFELPILSDIGRAISRQNISNNEFRSDEIRLAMNRGRIEVKNLNFRNSLARIAITGDAYVDGRLNLNVAGRVEQLDQPTLIDELLGSPLAKFGGTPTAFTAQAADFLSDRVVFLKVGGTFERPQVRVDSPQQLKEETIRYFLRDSKILPFQIQRDN